MTAALVAAGMDVARLPGDAVVVVGGTPPGTEASTNTVRLHRLVQR
jgi:hypothetical protein